MAEQKARCPYHMGLKRLVDYMITYKSRQIVEIRNGNELWYKLILANGEEYESMRYIHFCPACGKDLTK